MKAVVERCENLTEFYTKHVGMYEAALRNGWMEEFENLKRRNSYSLKYVIEMCNKYDSVGEFIKNVPGGLYHAYLRFYNNGSIKDGDVKWDSHTRKSWDYDSCFEEAQKYDSSWHFKLGCESAYNRARIEGWLGDWFTDCRYKHNLESCKELASQFESRTEFKEAYPGAYASCVRNGWIDSFQFEKSKFKWNKDKIIDACKKYKTKIGLVNNDRQAYEAYIRFKRKGLITDEELLWDNTVEKKQGDENDPIHYVYVYDFGNKVAYVGRTIEPKKRDKTHRRPHHAHGKDYLPPVLKYSMENDIPIPEMTILESELTMQESRKMEAVWCDDYINRGYTLLNTGSVGEFTGSIGGFKHIWTDDKIREFCKQFNTISELFDANDYVAKLIRKRGLLDELFPNRQKHVVADYDEFKKIASTCANRKEFREKYKNIYLTTMRHGWMEDFFPGDES